MEAASANNGTRFLKFGDFVSQSYGTSTYAIAKPVEETSVTGFTDNGTRFQVQGFCLSVMAL